MKKAFLQIIIFFPLIIFSQSEKYGALAVDENNGFYYGWAVDYETQGQADSNALKECKNKGGNCSIVKRWKGGWCMVYRTINGNVGTAYGWGIAQTKAEADKIATSECRKRSNGMPCSNYVWGCNSKSVKEDDDDDDDDDDDFWNGKKIKDENSQSNKSDFWTGKGSQKEEDYFKTHTKPEKSNQFIGEINSSTKYIKIICRDHGMQDGDRVALLLNKKEVESNIYLTNSPKTFRIQLKWGMNRIDFKALNQGSAGPNTAKFDVYDDTGRLISSKEWNLLTGFTGTLLITKF